ncbi:MAG: hypothetical protein WBE26_04335 [Phycisphaerae bacterium]
MARTRRFLGVTALPYLCLIMPVHAAPPSEELQAELEQALGEFDEAQSIQMDQPDRARQLFRSAAQRFTSIIAAGAVNGRLEFNLANCHLQAGDVGRAILHYRRAERLIPRNPMLADNLAVARSRCFTTIQPTRQSALFKLIFLWHYQTSVAGRTRAALVLYIAFWALLIARNFASRRFIMVTVVLAGLLSGAAAGSVAMARLADRNAPEGVITAMDVTVYKGPGTGYQRQFEQPLQPGVEFTRRQRRGGWWWIELADGKSGWIEATEAGLIPRAAVRFSPRT